MPRKAITIPNSTLPAGPFSLAIAAEPFLFLSGQLGLDPATGKLAPGGAAEQCAQIFRNLETVLKAGGKTLGEVIKATVYLTDMAGSSRRLTPHAPPSPLPPCRSAHASKSTSSRAERRRPHESHSF
jgi:enamine deaminase RidA (YjgF/YER057c/UK114 family)